MAFDFAQWQSTWVEAVSLAWQDPAFRQELIADPRTAIKVHLNVELPGDFDIEVIEDSDLGQPLFRKAKLAIPPKPASADTEANTLSEYTRELMVGRSTICLC
ncbi:MAG: hypothetical protein MJE77_09060 [Proteobacteria bacterium]|nr:hypothetical protein [Pseudomonadota bacterium]